MSYVHQTQYKAMSQEQKGKVEYPGGILEKSKFAQDQL